MSGFSRFLRHPQRSGPILKNNILFIHSLSLRASHGEMEIVLPLNNCVIFFQMIFIYFTQSISALIFNIKLYLLRLR